MPHVDKMSMKAFWEAVERRLAACSTDELRAILRAMAQETPPAARQAFLGKLQPLPGTDAAIQQAVQQEDLLADIDDLARELKEQTQQAEGWGEYGWGEYDDEDSLGPYEEFVEPLAALFDRAEAAFDFGDLALARRAYQKLFEALTLEDDYGRGVRADDLSDVDIDEARARYLRAVYETGRPARHPQTLFEQMRQTQSWLAGRRPMLDNIIQITPHPLPDQNRFLRDWIDYLRKQSGGDADAWLREAVRLAQGTSGLEELARAEGKKRPRAYLDWLAALEEEGRHREVLLAAQEALQTLPAKLPIRAAIADHLCAAAARLNETETLRAGRWEAFIAKPMLARLLDLWDAAPSHDERAGLMGQAAGHVKDYLAHPPRSQAMLEAERHWDDLESPGWIDKSVLAHAYLLAGQWQEAQQLAARENVLGWSGSDNPQGLVMPFFLVRLAGKSPTALPGNLAQLWRQRLEASIGFGSWSGTDEDSLLKRLERAYAERLSDASLSHDQEQQLLSWCIDVAKRRVEAIVGHQRRGSYNKAAVLTAACAETLRLRGDDKAADALVDDIRNRFPRHRAFQAELDTALEHMKRSRRRR